MVLGVHANRLFGWGRGADFWLLGGHWLHGIYGDVEKHVMGVLLFVRHTSGMDRCFRPGAFIPYVFIQTLESRNPANPNPQVRSETF